MKPTVKKQHTPEPKPTSAAMERVRSRLRNGATPAQAALCCTSCAEAVARLNWEKIERREWYPPMSVYRRG